MKWKILLVSLIAAVGIKVSHASFYWHHPDGVEEKIELRCKVNKDLQKRVLEYVDIIVKEEKKLNPDCIDMKPPVEVKGKCIVFYSLMIELKDTLESLQSDYKDLCKEA